ncbi:hypothetical protein CGT86_03675 [Vibrio cholerae]|nr:hypothetical protein CGT86_03675 [Vibrio cholerae]PAR89302.1 hypothetical protein CGT84_03220 [Vibrio cholerae]
MILKLLEYIILTITGLLGAKMERMDEELVTKKHLIDEHFSRYKLFSNLVEGRVVDCACGIGYSSEIILNHTKAESYIGIDISKDSIEIALSNYKKENVNFKVGSLTNLDLEDNYADTFFCMETLEHVEEDVLDNCLDEVTRVLKPNGIFIGSVPTKRYDDKCESVYGPNKYHITRFTQEKLDTILKKYFVNVKIGVMTRQVSSCFIIDENECDFEVEHVDNSESLEFGSFLFICSNEDIKDDISNKFFLSQSLVEYDQDQLIPVYESMRCAEKMALERYELIKATEEICEQRLRLIKDMEEKFKYFLIFEKIIKSLGEKIKNLK